MRLQHRCDAAENVVADVGDRALLAGAGGFDALPGRVRRCELQVDVADALKVRGIGFLQVGGFVGVAARFFGSDIFLSDLDRDVQQHDQLRTRQAEDFKLNLLDRPQQFLTLGPVELGSLMSQVGRDVTVTDNDIAAVERVVQNTFRLEAVSGVEHARQKWMHFVELAEATVEELTDRVPEAATVPMPW